MFIRARKGGRALCWKRASDTPGISNPVFPDAAGLSLIYDAPTHDSRSSRLTPAAAGQGGSVSFVSTVTLDNGTRPPRFEMRTLLLRLQDANSPSTFRDENSECASEVIALPVLGSRMTAAGACSLPDTSRSEQHYSAGEARISSPLRHPELRAALATNCFVLAIVLLEIGAAFMAPHAGWFLPPTVLSGLAIWLGTPVIRAGAGLLIAAALLLVVIESRGTHQSWPQPQNSFLRF